MAKRSRYSKQALNDMFGTTGVSMSTVARWKLKWCDTGYSVAVDNYHSALQLIATMDIDPLLYQFNTVLEDDGDVRHTAVFYEKEHAVFFRLHQDFS
jgi:hypothetical protein